MVKARQMEDAVEGKDLNLYGWGMSEPRGVLGGDVGGDRDVAREGSALSLFFERNIGGE